MELNLHPSRETGNPAGAGVSKNRIFQLLDAAAPGDHAGRAVQAFLVLLIMLNVAAVIAETVKPIAEQWYPYFRAFDLLSVAVFTVEYLLRLWSCTVKLGYSDGLRGRVKFALTPMAIVDLVAVLPFYVPFFGVDLRFLRAIRLFRIFRVLKLARYSTALRMIARAIQSKKEELLVTLFAVALLLLISSSLIYFVEVETQPDEFSSIPAAMWWGVVTLTTVGYGDVYPVTVAGKALAAVIAILGIGMAALPTAILGAAFMEQLHHKERQPIRCPHCGMEIEEPGRDGARPGEEQAAATHSDRPGD